jgi:hypothetical protein
MFIKYKSHPVKITSYFAAPSRPTIRPSKTKALHSILLRVTCSADGENHQQMISGQRKQLRIKFQFTQTSSTSSPYTTQKQRIKTWNTPGGSGKPSRRLKSKMIGRTRVTCTSLQWDVSRLPTPRSTCVYHSLVHNLRRPKFTLETLQAWQHTKKWSTLGTCCRSQPTHILLSQVNE